jgi:NAD(P)H-hydrate epimerase
MSVKILTAEQIRLLDRYTIENEPIPSIDLMEKASGIFISWFLEKEPETKSVVLFCGPGNNGGDGLAVARMLAEKGIRVQVFDCKISDTRSQDNKINLNRLIGLSNVEIFIINKNDPLPGLEESIVIDALFGSGLSRSIEGYWADLVNVINNGSERIYSIDIPSGVFADKPTSGSSIHADYTLSFELPKLAFLLPSNGRRVQNWEYRSIGLSGEFLNQLDSSYRFITREDAQTQLMERNRFAHKGNFGHALLIAGSHGKMGAAVLAASACLRSGVGLLTCHIPRSGYAIVQTSIPEAMVRVDKHDYTISEVDLDEEIYNGVGLGCGLGTAPETEEALNDILKAIKIPLVIDADGLNIISRNPEWLNRLPPHTILTPHPKEFERLFGTSDNDIDRLDMLRMKAIELKLNIVLKGAHTAISNPDGIIYFNSTGNAGMATAGSGDVLTGIILGMLAQGYSPDIAARLGVFMHGLAGDKMANKMSEESMIASDIISGLSHAFLDLKHINR